MAVMTTIGPTWGQYLARKIQDRVGMELDIVVYTHTPDYPDSITMEVSTKEPNFWERRRFVARYTVSDPRNKRRMKWVMTRFANQVQKALA